MIATLLPVPDISLEQARQAADDIYTQMCSSVAVARISRAERNRRLRAAHSIIEKIDADPRGAHLAPREWRLIRDWLQPGPTTHPLLDNAQDQGHEQNDKDSEEYH